MEARAKIPEPITGAQPHPEPAETWEPPTVEELQRRLPQYEVQSFIGRGGMGAVYRGVQRFLERTVAIKILPPDLEGDGQVCLAERFQQEARVLASLSHPGIVTFYDAGRSGGSPAADANPGDMNIAAPYGAPLLYLVMEYIEGTDLARLIASEGRIEPAWALNITMRVCDALAFAHQKGIMHRDIKPSNIMLDKCGRVKVVDFGLAKMLNLDSTQHTDGHLAMGTAGFVAPEALVAGTKADQRADIYAVGVMLYQMLTGEIPCGHFELPSQALPQIDARFDAIIGKAMQCDREKRYSSALELRADLDRITTTPLEVVPRDRALAA